MQTTIRKFDSIDTCDKAVADLIITLARHEIAAKDVFTLALSGGNTPKSLFSLLADEPCRTKIDWGAVNIFWGDERVVAPSHPDSNYKMARDYLLDHVPVPPENIFPIPVGEKSPESGAMKYDALLQTIWKKYGGLDLVLLGMGEDGHTASLFPHNPVLTRTSLAAAVPEATGKPPYPRITLTLKAINSCSHVAFVISGEAKREIFARIRNNQEKAAEMYPAAMVQAEEELYWFVAP